MSTKLITDTMRIDRLYDDYRALQAQIAEALKLAGAYAMSLHGPRDIVDTVKTLQAVLGREIEEHQRHHDADAALLTERDELRAFAENQREMKRALEVAWRHANSERDELREALRAIVDSEPGEKRADAMATGRTLLSRHPAQPVKGTP